MKILVENSTWNNIGDGWYQSALYSIIKDLYPNDQVYMGEGPIERAFRPNFNWQTENAFKIMNYQSADIHIFSGPIIGKKLEVYNEKIKNIVEGGNQYAMISVSCAGRPKEDKEYIKEFFRKYPPLFFSSRDPETYETFKDVIKNCYNGICTAFTVNRTLPVDSFKTEKPFFISSFYRELEPFYYLKNSDSPCTLENIDLKRKKTFGFLDFKFARHLNFRRPQQESLGDCLIVRVVQDVNTRYNHINFSHPNSFISFNPLSYLAVTKSAEFVLSDRVHACAIGLAFNKPVQFLYKTARAGIFDRMNFDYKSNNGIMYPNLNIIDDELGKLKEKILESI